MNIVAPYPGLTAQAVMESVRTVSSIVGGDWVTKKLSQENKRLEDLQKKSQNGKHGYFFGPAPHPLIGWALELEKWRAAVLETGIFQLNESVLKLYSLGFYLKSCRYESGFEKLVDRLKQKDSFFSAAFEAEVATQYKYKNFAVRFIEEGSNRTPDFYVKHSSGVEGYVECKCRDLLTPRDLKIKNAWDQLKKELLSEFGSKKLSFAIFVKSKKDPDASDIGPLKKFIIDSYSDGGRGKYDSKSGALVYSTDPSGKYNVVVNELLKQGEELKQEILEFSVDKVFDDVTMVTEGRVDEHGTTCWSSPGVIALANEVPTDRVSGIVNAFKSATGQLSKDKPGAIWIRIPDDAWNNEMEKAGDRAVELLRAEMSGGANTRVNAVVLVTRMTYGMKRGAENGMVYEPLYLTVENQTPANLTERSFWQPI